MTVTEDALQGLVPETRLTSSLRITVKTTSLSQNPPRLGCGELI